MAGISGRVIARFISNNSLYIIGGLGLYYYYKNTIGVEKTYRYVYAKNDYERKTHIKELQDFIDSAKKNTKEV